MCVSALQRLTLSVCGGSQDVTGVFGVAEALQWELE